jgi:hypothetical protein
MNLPAKRLGPVIIILTVFFSIAPPASAAEDAKQSRNPGGNKSQLQPGLLGWKAAPLKGPINAERPGFSTSPQPLPFGHLQIEGGYQFTHDDHEELLEDHTAPLLLMRVGLLRNLEFQLGWAGYSLVEVDGDTDLDANDMTIALKTKVFDQRSGLPTVGLLGLLSLPAGTGDATSDAVDPSVGLLWTYDLPGAPGLFGTTLFSSLTEDEDRFFQTAVAVGVGTPLIGPLGTFLEYYGFFRDDRGPSHNLDGGFTYLVDRNLQLDINAGVGLNERADDLFIGGGFAKRW